MERIVVFWHQFSYLAQLTAPYRGMRWSSVLGPGSWVRFLQSWRHLLRRLLLQYYQFISCCLVYLSSGDFDARLLGLQAAPISAVLIIVLNFDVKLVIKCTFKTVVVETLEVVAPQSAIRPSISIAQVPCCLHCLLLPLVQWMHSVFLTILLDFSRLLLHLKLLYLWLHRRNRGLWS